MVAHWCHIVYLLSVDVSPPLFPSVYDWQLCLGHSFCTSLAHPVPFPQGDLFGSVEHSSDDTCLLCPGSGHPTLAEDVYALVLYWSHVIHSGSLEPCGTWILMLFF